MNNIWIKTAKTSKAQKLKSIEGKSNKSTMGLGCKRPAWHAALGVMQAAMQEGRKKGSRKWLLMNEQALDQKVIRHI